MSESRGVLLIRADGNTQIGSGHVMRCLALAQAWCDAGGSVVFAMSSGADAFRSKVESEVIPVYTLKVAQGEPEDADAICALACEIRARWVVTDGYSFGEAYHARIRRDGLRLLVIDDTLEDSGINWNADILLNQNFGASQSMYLPGSPGARLLLGTTYALLRREFIEWRDWKRQIPDAARRLFVTMGGSDPDNVTLKVMDALILASIKGLKARVAVGNANPHSDQLRKAASKSGGKIEIAESTVNMPDLMAWADMAISAGGATLWEIAFMGLPCITIVISENQRPIAENLERCGVVWNAGWHDLLSPADIASQATLYSSDIEGRRLSSIKGRGLVDGRGASRVVDAMIQFGGLQ